MADDHLAQHSAPKGEWTKLFTAFRIALDLKKLLLAAGGIVSTALGWWIFAAIFYGASAMPVYLAPIDANVKEAWDAFKVERQRWNLLHEMAGPLPTKPSEVIRVDAGDIAGSYEEFARLDGWAKDYYAKKRTLGEIEAEGAAHPAALEKFTTQLQNPAAKPVARLRSWPFTEDRGPNQYLLIEGLLRKDAEGQRSVPWASGQFLNWLLGDQLPVLVEPLTKFLAPIGYFFNASAGGFKNRLYLILVIVWTLGIWGFFGGAICRIAAVQIAKNEKISMREAVGFAQEKCLSLCTAPLFPLVRIGFITFILAVFGLIEGFTVFFGDIVLAGLLFPIVIIMGLVMAVVLVGLIGWPLMNPTIAAEGSDNFDALSRSYSYVFQALWHYLAYWGMALLYGAALIFFIGFMGSMVIYLGRWGLSQAPFLQSSDPSRDREPAYLFHYAPTSFGWRDLLIKDSLHVDETRVVTSSGAVVRTYEFNDKYKENMTWYNHTGAVLVGVWIGMFFLWVVGFGYSYFWTASTLIYFLMRKHVDDTEMEEVFYEEGDLEPPPSVAPAPEAKPNTVSLNVVDAGPSPTAVVAGPPPQVALTASPVPPSASPTSASPTSASPTSSSSAPPASPPTTPPGTP